MGTAKIKTIGSIPIFPSNKPINIIYWRLQMALIDWNDKLATGVSAIDNDHKKLVQMVNALNEAMKTGQGKDIMGKLLKDLASYTMTHFAMEERLMKENKYPEEVEHCKQHEALRVQVRALIAKQEAGAVAITLSVMNFLKDWLGTHIMNTDQKLGFFLKGINKA
jgi:hemerythrin